VALIVADPSLPPLHVTSVCADTDEVIAGGCINVTVWVSEQPFASVIVHEYVPALNPVAVAAVPPLGDQL
jgi:hypothetical protein